jgi:hypothetical protein
MHEYCAELLGIEVGKPFDDDITGFPFVGALYFLGRHGTGHGNLTIEVVGMGGAKAWDGLSGLCERDGVAGVGVHDRANGCEGLEESAMSGSVRGGPERATDLATIKIDEHDVLRL